MVPSQPGRGSTGIGSWFKASEGTPQESDIALDHAGVLDQENQRPGRHGWILRQLACIFGILVVAGSGNGQATGAVGRHSACSRGHRLGKLTRQFPPGFADADEDALAALVDGRAGIVEGVHRQVGDDE